MTAPERAAAARVRRRRRRRVVALRWATRLAVVAAVFAVGVSLGRALRDNPRPGGTITYVRTLEPGARVGTPTVTITVTVTTSETG